MNGAEDNTYSQAGSSTAQAATAPGPEYASYPPPPYSYAPPPPPPPSGAPNPGLATLLGFVPGVGAMYNGQFAKGLAHIVIFAVLTSLADHVNGIFGLLVAGWVFYMVFDAYQTARARRDGLVIPDPFGLNNIGERFGMQGGPHWGDFMARPAPGTGAPHAGGPVQANPYSVPATETAVDPVTGAPVQTAYAGSSASGTGIPYPPPATPYGAGSAYVPAASAAAYAADPVAFAPGTVPPPYSTGYNATYSAVDPYLNTPIPPAGGNRSSMPTGAFWLIGLGVLFLVGSLAHNFYWSGHLLGTFFLLALGIALVVQRTLASRSVYPSGTAAASWNLVHQNRPGIFLIIVGVLQALNNLGIATWHYTWPYLLISVGLFQVLDRALYNRMLTENQVFPNGYASAAPGFAAASAGAYSATPDAVVADAADRDNIANPDREVR